MTAVGVVHWQPPDPVGDIALQAFRPGAAAPRTIHVRPELQRRLGCPHRGRLWGLPLVVDATLPSFPGFEIHRVPPTRG